MDFDTARARLIEQLGREIRDEAVLAAMARVPRELFIPDELRASAYENRPLPIGLNQTISQPFMVALMTEALELSGGEKVLELGTGSGYQTAILAELAGTVVTVERLPELAESAGRILETLGYTNIILRPAGHRLGWPVEAPYDAIVSTAGAPGVPSALLEQLKIGGRLVIPVGSRHTQELYKITRQIDGNKLENLGGCRFVSLIGQGAWD